MEHLAHTGLNPSTYTDSSVLERERATLFRTNWQWAGMVEDLQNSGGIATQIAGLPVTVEGDAANLRVSLTAGSRHRTIQGALADVCGRFVFVRLAPQGLSLSAYLGDYAEIVTHCSETFLEPYDRTSFEWSCNWKAAIESLLEGYHVAYVHASPPDGEAGPADTKEVGSNLADSLPGGEPSIFAGPHSYQRGLLSEGSKKEMAGVARRLKLAPSTRYSEYDQFTLFPNMIIGMAGGCLCFMHIFDPVAIDHAHMRNIYLLARPMEAEKVPSPLIKAGVLAKWRDYNATVIAEDRLASERRQIGMQHAWRPGAIGHVAEERVVHFHNQWRTAMGVRLSAEAA